MMMMMMTLYSLVLYVIDDNIDEDEPAIYYGSEDDPSLIVSHITFGQLKRMSNRVANMLGVTKTSNCRMLQLYN